MSAIGQESIGNISLNFGTTVASPLTKCVLIALSALSIFGFLSGFYYWGFGGERSLDWLFNCLNNQTFGNYYLNLITSIILMVELDAPLASINDYPSVALPVLAALAFLPMAIGILIAFGPVYLRPQRKVGL